MCLFSITKVQAPTKRPIKAYKILLPTEMPGVWTTPFYVRYAKRIEGEWQEATENIEWSFSDGKKYNTGFHCFPTQEAAKQYLYYLYKINQLDRKEDSPKILEIRVKGVHTKGTQDISINGIKLIPTLVVKYMMIPKQEKKKKNAKR